MDTRTITRRAARGSQLNASVTISNDQTGFISTTTLIPRDDPINYLLEIHDDPKPSRVVHINEICDQVMDGAILPCPNTRDRWV